MYSGCNNNMGVEVIWRLIKALCNALSTLGVFLGHLCHFIRTALREEHRMLLINAGTPNAFIRRPKEMWMRVQECHRMTLSGCFVIDGTRNAEQRFRDVTI